MGTAPEAHVTLAPRRGQAILFSAPDLRSALGRIRANPPADASRLAIWTGAPLTSQRPEVVVCVPLASFDHRRAQAEEVVARWDSVWLLIASVARGHRAAAHQHLVDEISMALLAAALEGEDGPALDDVGFEL